MKVRRRDKMFREGEGSRDSTLNDFALQKSIQIIIKKGHNVVYAAKVQISAAGAQGSRPGPGSNQGRGGLCHSPCELNRLRDVQQV